MFIERHIKGEASLQFPGSGEGCHSGAQGNVNLADARLIFNPTTVLNQDTVRVTLNDMSQSFHTTDLDELKWEGICPLNHNYVFYM